MREKKIRILQVTGEYFDDFGRGVGAYTYNLCKSLSKIGHDVDVVCHRHGELRGEIPGVNIINVPFGETRWVRYYKWGYDAAQKILDIHDNYDVIHAHLPTCLTYLLFKKDPLPIVLTVHTTYMDPIHPYWRKPYIFYRDRISYKKSNKLIPVSSSIADELKEMGVNKNKIKVIPVGTDINRYHPLTKKDDDFMNQYNINKNKIKALFVGSIKPRKGIDYLLEAIETLNPEISDKIFLAIVGTGPSLKENITKYSHLKNVSFYGFVDDELVPKFYQNSDIFILPSLYEGLPTVLLEAMASKLAIIATDIPSVRNVINDDNGLLIEPKSIEAIKNAIQTLVDDSDIRRKIAKKGYDDSKKYDWDVLAQDFIKIYSEVIT